MPMRVWPTWSVSLVICLGFIADKITTPTVGDESPTPKFESDIVPILETRCLKCHGDGKLEAGLDLRRRFLII